MSATSRLLAAAIVIGSLLPGLSGPVMAQSALGTAFTYQGRLDDGAGPASGVYDLQFALFTASTGGTPVGSANVRDDVTVADGLFTVKLDFGAAAFAGSARWLEIGVRPGASTGAYTTLAPRQELTPAPNALFSANAATIAGLACANGQVAKWNNGWSCGPDLDTNSGGTVTSVATGAGLTGGPITGTGTLAVAPGGITSGLLADAAVTSTKIATGAVGLAQINQAQVQARVGGSCIQGEYLRGINPDGTVVCELLPIPTSITTLAPMFFFGASTSITIGPGGRPVISLMGSNGTLDVVRCGNAGCTAGNVVTTVDAPANGVGAYSSIAIGSGGLPVISYYDIDAAALKVARCGNAACTAGNTLATVDDPANAVGSYSAIAAGSDGLPVISYYDETAGNLKVAHCGNAACTSGNSIAFVDGLFADVGSYTSIAIGSDGLPIISYRDSTAGALKVVKCGTVTCAGGNTITTVDDAGDVGLHTSITIAPDGRPLISYQDFTNRALKVARCGNPACSSSSINTIATVDNVGDVGAYTSIAIGSDGLPVISYRDSTNSALKVAKCGNASCTTGNTVASVDGPANDVGRYTSIAIGSDGLPIISYNDASADTLKVAKCGNPACR